MTTATEHTEMTDPTYSKESETKEEERDKNKCYLHVT